MIYDDSVPGCTQKYACFVHLKPFHQYQATGTGKGIFSCDNVLFSDTFSWSYYVYIHSSCIPMQQQQVFGSLYIIFGHFKLTVCTRLLEIEGINYVYWHGNQPIFQSQSLFLDYRLHRKQSNFYKFLGAHHNLIHVWTKE